MTPCISKLQPGGYELSLCLVQIQARCHASAFQLSHHERPVHFAAVQQQLLGHEVVHAEGPSEVHVRLSFVEREAIRVPAQECVALGPALRGILKDGLKEATEER